MATAGGSVPKELPSDAPPTAPRDGMRNYRAQLTLGENVIDPASWLARFRTSRASPPGFASVAADGSTCSDGTQRILAVVDAIARACANRMRRR